jgi:GT2 family glycosyltransferase
VPPAFTVAIPTHNRRDTVVLAARSALMQTLPPAEVLVVCDGCTDGTQAALEAIGDPRLHVLDLPKGPGYAYDHRNRALEQAQTEAIVYLGDDDLLLPDHLAQIASAWGDAIDVVTTPAIIVAPDDGLSWIGADWSAPGAREHLRRENTNVMASVAIRVALAQQVGGWDGAISRAADWDLWRRALEAGARPAAVAEPTVLHFKATGRDQAWPDRVAQNRRWLETIADDAALAELRPGLRRLRAVRELALLTERLELHGHVAAVEQGRQQALEHARGLEAEDARHTRELQAAHAEIASQRVDLTELEARLADRDAHVTRAEELLADLREDRDQARATLAAIYAGRWWRLRDALRLGRRR